MKLFWLISVGFTCCGAVHFNYDLTSPHPSLLMNSLPASDFHPSMICKAPHNFDILR